MKRQLSLCTLALVAGSTAFAASEQVQADRVHRHPTAPRIPVALDNPLPAPLVKTTPDQRVDEWLGSHVVLGTTRYDYQHNGSTSRMLAVSSDGIVHGSFMGGLDASAGRRIRVWCVDPADMSLVDPADALSQHTGYTTHATTSANPGNGLPANSGVVGFHSSAPSGSWIGADFAGCTLAFNLVQHAGANILWPHVAVDGSDRIHMVSYGSSDSATPNTHFYNSSSNGTSFDSPTYHTLTTNSESLGSIPVAASHTQRAALLYFEKTGPEDMPYDGPPEGGEIGIQIHHDVRGYIAANGNLAAEITAGNMINFTDYGPGSDSPFGPYGSRGYCDVDGLFDMTAGENLHIAFSTAVMFSDTLTVYDGDGDSTDNVYYNWNLGRGQIWHLNADTGDWSMVAGTNCAITDEEFEFFRPQGWRMWRDRPQMAVDPATGRLYTIWSEYTMADTSAAGYFNGEIMARCSADNGLTWGPAVNLTNTATPGCASGDCEGEDWPSMAFTAAGGFLHITFVHDLDAGGIPFDPPEGAQTVNNVIYMKVPVSAVPPHTGTPWDAAGRVGLVTDTRWFTWICSAWSGETAYLDSAHWVEPVDLFNESPYDVQVDGISYYHHPSDLLGTPEDGGLFELGLEVQVNGQWIPVSEWNGWLPQWRGTKFRAHVAYSGLPTHNQLLVFHFDDRPDLVYHIAYDSDTEGCPGVNTLDPSNLAAYTEYPLYTVDVQPASRPGAFALEPNFPNPFNPVTTIAFTVEHGGPATLTVHNLLGETVATLVDGPVAAGRHTVTFDATGLASGVYLYTLEAAGRSESRKLVVLK
jgi:hypothetical protein